MTIKDNTVYLTEAELDLVKQAKAASWTAPEIYLKQWRKTTTGNLLTESLDTSFYKNVVDLINTNNYKIIK